MDNKVQIIKQICTQVLPGCEVILFGSRARTDYTEDSDYDILVIPTLELDPVQKSNYRATIRRNLANLRIPVDVLIHSEKEIEIKKITIGHIVRQVLKEGIIV